jgi:hypothetical protein
MLASSAPLPFSPFATEQHLWLPKMKSCIFSNSRRCCSWLSAKQRGLKCGHEWRQTCSWLSAKQRRLKCGHEWPPDVFGTIRISTSLPTSRAQHHKEATTLSKLTCGAQRRESSEGDVDGQSTTPVVRPEVYSDSMAWMATCVAGALAAPRQRQRGARCRWLHAPDRSTTQNTKR